jgi:hypothetical protein
LNGRIQPHIHSEHKSLLQINNAAVCAHFSLIYRFVDESGPGFELLPLTLSYKAGLTFKAGVIPQITVYLW